MLAKKFRLPLQNFLRIRSRGISNDFFIVKKAENVLGYHRFGVLISGKVSKKAVVRNNFRRFIFNVIRDAHAIGARQELSFDIMIIVRPEAVRRDQKEIKNHIVKLIDRVIHV